MSDAFNDSRLTDLEIRLAHFEAMAEDLSQMVARQDIEISRLKMQVKALLGQVRDMESQLPHQRNPADEPPPPHY